MPPTRNRGSSASKTQVRRRASGRKSRHKSQGAVTLGLNSDVCARRAYPCWIQVAAEGGDGNGLVRFGYLWVLGLAVSGSGIISHLRFSGSGSQNLSGSGSSLVFRPWILNG